MRPWHGEATSSEVFKCSPDVKVKLESSSKIGKKYHKNPEMILFLFRCFLRAVPVDPRKVRHSNYIILAEAGDVAINRLAGFAQF